MTEISKRILNLITEKEISYGALSAQTRIPKSALQRYATGETEKIPMDRLETIARALGVSITYLLGWEDQKPSIPAYDKIKFLCDANQISIEYLCDYSDIPLEDVRALMYSRELLPSQEICDKIAAFFEISPDFFVPGVFEETLPAGVDISLFLDIQRKLSIFGGIGCNKKGPVNTEIEDIYNALNKDGQHELCRYGSYLMAQDQYKALDAEPQISCIRHYLTAAAAGYAAPIEGEDYELVPRDISVPAGADFCIDIDGDSMEPYIKNGQRVYVQQNVSLKEFEVGIFFVDGDVYCKQWCEDDAGTLHLLSANPRREDANISVPRDSGRSVICFGKVLVPKPPRPEYLK